MGKAKKPPHTPGPPEPTGSQQTGSIRPFLAPLSTAEIDDPDSKMAAAACSSASSSPTHLVSVWDPPNDLCQLLQYLPSKEDLAIATTELGASLLSEIRALRTNLGGIQTRLQHVEVTQEQQSVTIAAHSSAITTQRSALQMMARHLEDVENRNRRNNIRVQGLPELENSQEELKCTLIALFNDILERDPATDIEMELYHRALRPKGPPDAPPHNVICCLLRYPLKDSILAAARGSRTIDFAGAKISLFQDLSPATLQSRRMLRLLTAALQDMKLQYKWLFPFGLQVRTPSGPLNLRSELDLPLFLEELSLPPDTLPAWPDLALLYMPPEQAPSRPRRSRRRRQSSSSQAPVD
uniref:Uncharacterized protein n=1 Tax=Leptobrachium leishanense TaxID=445787 RepID=A0A8C5QPB1_9ANUR